MVIRGKALNKQLEPRNFHFGRRKKCRRHSFHRTMQNIASLQIGIESRGKVLRSRLPPGDGEDLGEYVPLDAAIW